MSDNAVYWDDTKDESLIAFVRFMPELYNVNSPKFNNTIARRIAWQTIGASLMIAAEKCEERWEYLLSVQRGDPQFQASTSKLGQTEKKSNNGEEQTAKNPDVVVVDLEPELLEVADLLEKKPEDLLSPPNVVFQPSLPENRTASKESTSPHPPAPLVGIGNGENRPPHSIDVFFMCMANTVKSFNAIDQHMIKYKLFNWVREKEVQYTSSQNYVLPPSISTLLMPPLSIRFPPEMPNRPGYGEPCVGDCYYYPPK